MLNPSEIDAVLFDIGGVFTLPEPSLVQEELRSRGHEPPTDLEWYRKAHHAGVRAITNGASIIDEGRKDFWFHYEEAYVTTLGLEFDEKGFEQISWTWVQPHNVTGFQRIAGRLPVGIVSNNSGTAAEQMVDAGVCQVGPGPLTEAVVVIDSTLEGVAKPDPAIFTPALEALGTAPERTLYIGDTYHADVVGAQAGRLPIVQLDPYDDHADMDHIRAADVGVIANWLAG